MWNVVEYSTEDVVVGEFEKGAIYSEGGLILILIRYFISRSHSRAYVNKNLAEDVKDQVLSAAVQIVEGSIFP